MSTNTYSIKDSCLMALAQTPHPEISTEQIDVWAVIDLSWSLLSLGVVWGFFYTTPLSAITAKEDKKHE